MFIRKYLLIVSVMMLTVLACTLSTSEPPTATPDVQATVDVAVGATATAQAASVPTETPVPTPVPTPRPETASPSTDEYVALSEEELNAAIDQAVAEAIAAYEEAYAYTGEASSDGELTQEEINTIYVDYAYAEELITLADEYIGLYYDLYADLVGETVDMLGAIEEDLAAMEDAMNEVVAIMDTAAETLQAGQEIRQETIDQLTATIEGYQEMSQEVASAWEDWSQSWMDARDQRLQELQNITPDTIPDDRKAALNETARFADAVRDALGDASLSSRELQDIVQLGANAAAGLQKQGPALQSLAGRVSEITDQLARGDMPGAITSLGDLEGALRSIPGAPPRPEFSPPTLPSLPSHPTRKKP